MNITGHRERTDCSARTRKMQPAERMLKMVGVATPSVCLDRNIALIH